MTYEHVRTAVAHDFAYPLPHLGRVAVHFAVAAKCLALRERAARNARVHVIHELLTILTDKPRRTAVLLLAVICDHLRNEPFFILPLLFRRFSPHALLLSSKQTPTAVLKKSVFVN